MKFYEQASYIGSANQLPSTDDRMDQFEKDFKEKGFDDSCTWSLDYSIGCFILPRLKRYLEITDEMFVRDDQYYEDMKKMVEGFELVVEDRMYTNEARDTINKAFEILAKRHAELWW